MTNTDLLIIAQTEISRLEQEIARCRQCRGIGYVKPDLPPGAPGFGRMVPCPSCSHHRARSGALRLLVARFDAVSQFISADGTLAGCRFDNFSVTSDNQAAYNAVRQWVDVPSSPPWLYLWGPPGNGKTHLAAAAVNALHQRGEAAVMFTAPNLLSLLRQSSVSTPSDYNDLFLLIARIPWLVVDDLGTERVSDWVLATMFQVLDARYTRRERTLIVANFPPKDYPEPRISSRFADRRIGRVVVNTAPDHRLTR